MRVRIGLDQFQRRYFLRLLSAVDVGSANLRGWAALRYLLGDRRGVGSLRDPACECAGGPHYT